jgi:hypothetical protein
MEVDAPPDLASELSKLYGETVVVWGPYVCSDGRRRVDVKTSSHPNGITYQYAKVLLELKLGRRLSQGETVDHKDEDKTNDTPDNLQVLTLSENAKKSCMVRGSNLKQWQKSKVGTAELSALTSGEHNSQAKMTDDDVKRLRERFMVTGRLSELAGSVSVNRKSLRHLLEGRTYKSAGGPLVVFKRGSHSKYVIASSENDERS